MATGTATVNLTQSITLPSLDISGSARVNLTAGGTKALQIGNAAAPATPTSFSVTTPASPGASCVGLDLNDNGLMVEAGNAADRDALLPAISALINTGFPSNGRRSGYWNGDLNLDGLINFDDYYLINSEFLGQSGHTPVPPMTKVARPFNTKPVAVRNPRKIGASRRTGKHHQPTRSELRWAYQEYALTCN